MGILTLLLFDNDQLRPRLEHRERGRERDREREEWREREGEGGKE